MTCNSCNEEFEEPKVYKEYYGEPSLPPEKFYYCPYCGSEDIKGDYD